MGSATLDNTSPFMCENWCFAHNGTIRDFFPKVEGEREDMTDSERFFWLLLQENERTRGVMEETIGRVVDKVAGVYDYSSLTFLLSDGDSLYAYADVSDVGMEDYYRLMYAKNGDMVIFTQEPIWKKDWISVPNKCLVRVNKELRMRFTEFGE
ncbi:MAG: class II glutamine amidotransferase [Candidatus Bathyarchaeia archaeon]